ncbi:MAG: FTR1 family protein [Candidatus Hydrothermarchaeales archaeon]
MLTSFIITFREALEAALIVGIIAAYLGKIGRRDLNKYLWIGTLGAIVASITVAVIFMAVYGGLGGTAEKIFEGVATLTAAAVLTYMIFWMAKHANLMKGELEEKVDTAISTGALFGISVTAFFAVFREGVETVLFLGARAMQYPVETLIGLLAGVSIVFGLTILMFKGTYLLDLKKFFKYTSIILLIFAAGFVAYGVHELNEVGVVPPVIERVWDINPSRNLDGSYPALHEKGVIGSILKSLIGYNGDPSLTEVLAYLGYWLVVGSYVLKTYRFEPSPSTAYRG